NMAAAMSRSRRAISGPTLMWPSSTSRRSRRYGRSAWVTTGSLIVGLLRVPRRPAPRRSSRQFTVDVTHPHLVLLLLVSDDLGAVRAAVLAVAHLGHGRLVLQQAQDRLGIFITQTHLLHQLPDDSAGDGALLLLGSVRSPVLQDLQSCSERDVFPLVVGQRGHAVPLSRCGF